MVDLFPKVRENENFDKVHLILMKKGIKNFPPREKKTQVTLWFNRKRAKQRLRQGRR